MPLYLIILFPLIGFALVGLFGQKTPKPAAGVLASLAVGASFVAAVANFLALRGLPEHTFLHEKLYTWMAVGDFQVNVALMMDRLSGLMILIVTGIGFLIHVYSVGYMAHDHNDPQSTRYARYFAFLNLFIVCMSLLVLADNYLLMFVGWEGVGLCSYFLIGFWFERSDAAAASNKAFILNRIGDFGMLLAMMLIFLGAGSLQYTEVFARVAQFNAGTIGALGGVSLVTLLLLLGATGKSAQIPLYTWLPDAMAGPTPVSALIHAATMVTAGVYMMARSAALFNAAPNVMLIVCGIGAVTALAAGLTALAHNDIKKVLAYSTVSQLGFMFMAVGAGAYAAAIFHVFTHAFFKACLFLGAGSVIHALHGEQDMRKMGGLAAKMKTTNWTFLVSGLALAGAVPFAGFFSKDEIIAALFGAGPKHWLYWLFGLIALVAALVTALYTGRQYGQVFDGEPRDAHLYEGAHESPASMTIPLILLGIGSVLAGFLGLPHLLRLPQIVPQFLEPAFAGGAATMPAGALALGLLMLGIIIGWGGWFWGRSLGVNAERAMLPESADGWSLDCLYRRTIVAGGNALAAASRWFDEKIIDGFVNGVGAFIGQVGAALRLTQTSYVRNYALGMALGALVIIALLLVPALK
jgi:NADH-quinone oxidoreductase subunit L